MNSLSRFNYCSLPPTSAAAILSSTCLEIIVLQKLSYEIFSVKFQPLKHLHSVHMHSLCQIFALWKPLLFSPCSGWSLFGSRRGEEYGHPKNWHHQVTQNPQETPPPLPSPTALTVATPFEKIYLGLWSYNCVLSCIAVGGMFYALTWQTHLLALVCGEYLGKLATKWIQLLISPPYLFTWKGETTNQSSAFEKEGLAILGL